MPAIFPVSDLKDNYSAMVNNVSYGNRVYLTRRGEKKCALVDLKELDELDKQRALLELTTREAHHDLAKQSVNEQEGPDLLLYAAGKYIIESQKATIGHLQRRFKIGFSRAARIIDQLEELKVVEPQNVTKPREIYMNMNQFEEVIEKDHSSPNNALIGKK